MLKKEVSVLYIEGFDKISIKHYSSINFLYKSSMQRSKFYVRNSMQNPNIPLTKSAHTA